MNRVVRQAKHMMRHRTGLLKALFVDRLLTSCEYAFNPTVRAQNARVKREGAPDGLPVPPVPLIYLVTGGQNIEAFLINGAEGAECIRLILERNGLDMNRFESILDFGCGCGRIMRHWSGTRGPRLHGSDYNPRLVDWCKKSLPYAEFKLNSALSRLDYGDGEFDFIYAISVFIHLDEASQDFWVAEISRILRPGGYLLLTVHGTTRLHELSPAQRREFESGQLIVTRENYSGRNICAAFHPEEYVRERLCLGLRVVDFETGERLGIGQTILREFIGKWASFLTLLVGYLIVPFRRDKRALHDFIAGTQVRRR